MVVGRKSQGYAVKAVTKIFFVLAILGAGWFAASQYRRPEETAVALWPSFSQGQAKPPSVREGTEPPPAPSVSPPQPIAERSASPLAPAALIPRDGLPRPTAKDFVRPPLLGDRPSRNTATGPPHETRDAAFQLDRLRLPSEGETAADLQKEPKKKPLASSKKKPKKPAEVAANEQPSWWRRAAETGVEEPEADVDEDGKPRTSRDPSGSHSLAADGVRSSKTANAGPGDRVEQRRKHQIVDGDSLPRLAARYLGSESRWSEIYAANAPLLPDPRLLPIGAELTIPPADAANGSFHAAPQDDKRNRTGDAPSAAITRADFGFPRRGGYDGAAQREAITAPMRTQERFMQNSVPSAIGQPAAPVRSAAPAGPYDWRTRDALVPVTER